MTKPMEDCYKGHQWSPWRIVEAWDQDGKPGAIGGRPASRRIMTGERWVIRRICFACFDYEHKRMES